MVRWFALLVCLGLASPAAALSSFDYLYIEANEGGSSGGHTAIRFGEHTYHFQNRDGLLVIDREHSVDFAAAYALRSNRTIHGRRVAVREGFGRELHAQFRRRHRAQSRQLDVRDALRADRALLQKWLRAGESERVAEHAVDVPGAGYFLPGEGASLPATGHETSAALASLLQRVAERHGDDFIARKRAALRTELQAAADADPTAWAVELPADAYAEPPFAVSFAQRYANRAAALVALDVLEDTRVLRDGSFSAPEGDAFALDTTERDVLRRFAKRLEADLVQLFASPGHDWGPAALAGMARLAALERAQATGRLVFLDAFPADATRIDASTVARRTDVLPQILGEAHAQLAAARAAFATLEDPNERGWARVEQAANRAHELERALHQGRSLRVARGHLVPRISAPVAGLAAPRASTDELRTHLARVEARERDYTAQLDALYRYHLITRNCVSAIFETIRRAAGDSIAVSQEELGGHVEGRRSFAFIPFVSAAAVDRHYHVEARWVIPSFRAARLLEMEAREHPVWVALRESNTLTAQSYAGGQDDSPFLFFTDRHVLSRPIFGAVNLAVATGELAHGLLRFPLDRGRVLRAGAEGVLVSLPELAFGNIRKGSNDWVAPEYRFLEPSADESVARSTATPDARAGSPAPRR
ncbi:MAG: hypothetical protein AAF430_08015 [Myxococcota bacterium]